MSFYLNLINFEKMKNQ